MFLSTPGPPVERAKAEAPTASAHHNSLPGRPLRCRSIGPARPTSALLDRPYQRGVGKLLPLAGYVNWWSYTKAVVTCTFRVPPFVFDGSDPSGSPWTTTLLDVAGEVIELPGSTYYNGSTPLNTPIGLMIPQCTI